MTHIPTIGVDFKLKTIPVDDKKIKLQIWDTAGQERFRNITKTYYKGASGVILTYSITDKSSFENVEGWVKSIKENTSEDILQIMIGNKCDLEASRVVATKEGQQLANKYNIPFFEVSAK